MLDKPIISWIPLLMFMVYLQVLQDLERRRNLEGQLRWDFMALDSSGDNRLPLKEAFMLFSMAHGDDFHVGDWNRFLQSRGENEFEDVYFDEIKVKFSTSFPSVYFNELCDVL